MRSVGSRSIRIVRVFQGLYTFPTRPLQGLLHHSHRIHCSLGAKQGPSKGQAGAKGCFELTDGFRRSADFRQARVSCRPYSFVGREASRIT
jgi:hypothetical protein